MPRHRRPVDRRGGRRGRSRRTAGRGRRAPVHFARGGRRRRAGLRPRRARASDQGSSGPAIVEEWTTTIARASRVARDAPIRMGNLVMERRTTVTPRSRSTTEVIRNGLAAAALEMNRTLVRTAYNPLLYEVQDFGLGIVSADGRLWAEAPGIAGFISALSDTVRSGLAEARRRRVPRGRRPDRERPLPRPAPTSRTRRSTRRSSPTASSSRSRSSRRTGPTSAASSRADGPPTPPTSTRRGSASRTSACSRAGEPNDDLFDLDRGQRARPASRARRPRGADRRLPPGIARVQRALRAVRRRRP